MVMRKQLGLLMLFSASLHACFYLLMYSGEHGGFDTRASLYLGAGVIAYALAVVLGLSSLPRY